MSRKCVVGGATARQSNILLYLRRFSNKAPQVRPPLPPSKPHEHRHERHGDAWGNYIFIVMNNLYVMLCLEPAENVDIKDRRRSLLWTYGAYKYCSCFVVLRVRIRCINDSISERLHDVTTTTFTSCDLRMLLSKIVLGLFSFDCEFDDSDNVWMSLCFHKRTVSIWSSTRLLTVMSSSLGRFCSPLELGSDWSSRYQRFCFLRCPARPQPLAMNSWNYRKCKRQNSSVHPNRISGVVKLRSHFLRLR